MLCVKVAITRYVDDAFPGFVECRLIDADGRDWFFIEKVPVVTLAHLDASSQYPQTGVIACQILGWRHDTDGRAIVSIDTEIPWHVQSSSGRTRFDVLADQLVDFDWQGDDGEKLEAPSWPR
jgi:hypothetical protein